MDSPSCLSAQDVRETFKRMAMNDEETVALTGGHTFGKHMEQAMLLWLVLNLKEQPSKQWIGWMSRHALGKGSIPLPVELKGHGPPILLNGIWAIWIFY